MVQRIASDPPKVQIQVRFLVETLALQVYRIARQTTNLQDGVRFLGRALENVALEPDGTAAACKAVLSGFDSHRHL